MIRTDTSRARSIVTPAALVFVVATACVAIGIFVAGERDQDQVDAFPALVVFVALATALVFGLLVRPTLASGAGPARPLLLGLLAFVAVAVFFTGLPVVLGGAALLTAAHAPPSLQRTIGRVAAVVAIGASVLLAFVG